MQVDYASKSESTFELGFKKVCIC